MTAKKQAANSNLDLLEKFRGHGATPDTLSAESHAGKVYCLRCPACNQPGIIFKPGWHPDMGPITSDTWEAMYKAFDEPWYRNYILCQNCLAQDPVVTSGLRVAHNHFTGAFSVVGVNRRFIEEIDVEVGGYSRVTQANVMGRKKALRALEAALEAGVDVGPIVHEMTPLRDPRRTDEGGAK